MCSHLIRNESTNCSTSSDFGNPACKSRNPRYDIWDGMRKLGKRKGNEQMLGQATAVLVSLSARLALELDAVELSALFYERLSIAGATNTSLLSIIIAFVG